MMKKAEPKGSPPDTAQPGNTTRNCRPAPAGPATSDQDQLACIGQVMASVEKIAEAKGLRLTPIRRRVLEILLQTQEAMGAYDVLERLVDDGMKAQPPVAYRALEFLQAHGFVHRIERLNAFIASMHPAEDYVPAFMICRECRKVSEGHAAPPAELGQAAAQSGFLIERVMLEAEGLCPDCVAGR